MCIIFFSFSKYFFNTFQIFLKSEKYFKNFVTYKCLEKVEMQGL